MHDRSKRTTRLRITAIALLGGCSFAAFAGCDEEFMQQGPTHQFVRGYCDTNEEAEQACDAYAASHGETNGCSGHSGPDGIMGYEVGWIYIRPEKKFYFGSYVGTKAVPKPRKNAGPPACPDQCFGDPVNAGTATKFESRQEYLGEGPFPLRLTWTYSFDGASTMDLMPRDAFVFGGNRTFTYSRRVAIVAAPSTPTAHLLRPDGKVLRFRKFGPASSWTSDADDGGRFAERIDNGNAAGWRYDDEDGGREIFDATGRLVELYDAAGHRQTLSYNANGELVSVVDMAGRALGFEYDAASLVRKVNLPDGKSIQFQYSSQGQYTGYLTRVEYQDATSVEYRYNEPGYFDVWGWPGALTGVVDESGTRYASTTYDQRGRPTGVTLAGGADAYSATYQVAANQAYLARAAIVLPGGATRTMDFAVADGSVVPTKIVESCAGCPARQTDYAYDANGRLDTSTIDGTTTDHDYDERGRLTRRIDAANDAALRRTTQTDWHATLPVPLERRILDAGGSLVAKQSWTYNTRGQALTATTHDTGTAGTSRTTTLTYCEQADVDAGTCPLVGLVLSVDGPRNDVADTTTYAYHASDDASCSASPTTCPHRRGDLWKATNALGHVHETLRYDGAGRVLSTRDANGVVTDIEYDVRGRVVAGKLRGANDASETDDAITRIEYTATGLVRKVTQPDGVAATFTYDAARHLTGVADDAGNAIAYTLDAAGNRTNEETRDTNGVLRRALSQTYDQLGRIRTAVDAYGNATTYAYDARGDADTTTDARGTVDDSDHDALGRLTRTLRDAAGIAAQTQYRYDALDRVTRVTDPKGLDTQYAYNGYGELVELSSPDTGVATFAHNAAGNVVSRTDARGETATTGYDALGRATGIAYSDANLNVENVYDATQDVCGTGETYGIGRLTRMTDGTGRTQYCYDRFGRLVRKVQTTGGQTYAVRYAYDVAGRRTSMTYPSGMVVGYGYDALGRVASVTVARPGQAAQTLLSNVAYDAFGPVTTFVYGNGRTLARTYDRNYRPLTIRDVGTDGLSIGFDIDAVGNIAALRDGDLAAPARRLYAYDAIDRLIEARDGATNAPLHGYGYDATGNRTSAAVGTSTSSYAYAATSHRLASVGATSRDYDATGNTIAIGGTAKQFVYNAANRLAEVRLGGGTAALYAYNGRGEQVRRETTAGWSHTVYDDAGEWLGAYPLSGASTEIVRVAGHPVGMVRANKVYYIESDHLGTPRVVIDPARERAVWTWSSDGEAFGDSTPNADPDGDGVAFVFDLRFPGQVFDAASGFNYNYFRDYDASTGRYAQSDPIGLNGGLSTYRYANASPLLYFDPNGLQACRNVFCLPEFIQKRLLSSSLKSVSGWTLENVHVQPITRPPAPPTRNIGTMPLSAHSGKHLATCLIGRIKTYTDVYERYRQQVCLQACSEGACGRSSSRWVRHESRLGTFERTRKEKEMADQYIAPTYFPEMKCLELVGSMN